ncbi:MAG: zinc-ribbon domain-containing protein [Prevotella sp.]|nr:zinc-ribbon domain-containing protein [Prevotella sp.]
MKECPNCHAQIEDNSLFCTECGKPFSQEKICPHCGATMDEDDVFCQNCGKKPDDRPEADNRIDCSIKCPYCGSPMNEGDVFCQNCGKNIVGSIPATQPIGQPIIRQQYEKPTGSSNIGTILLSIFGVLVLSALCAGGFWYYKYEYAPKKAAEEAKILAEQEKKAAIQRQDSLDQVLWQKTIEKDDEEAYQLYLQKFPLGKHAEQAKKRVDYAAKLKLTSDEEYEVQSKIQSFFYSISNGYEDDMISYLSPSMTSFLGKKNASKVDAMAYLHKIHSSDVFSVKIMMGDISVKKELDSEQNPVYTANFNYDQRIEREDTSLETFASIKGTATLNNLFKITSLALTKTASY